MPSPEFPLQTDCVHLSWPWQDTGLGWRDLGCWILVGCASHGPVEQGMEIPVLCPGNPSSLSWKSQFPVLSSPLKSLSGGTPLQSPAPEFSFGTAELPAPWEGRKCDLKMGYKWVKNDLNIFTKVEILTRN